MKIRFVILFFLIAALLSTLTYYGLCKNNYDSYAHRIVNYSYAAKHNPPTFTGRTAGGTDVDFPLFATTDIWAVYSDLGVENTDSLLGWFNKNKAKKVDNDTPPPMPDWVREEAENKKLYVPGKVGYDEGLRDVFWHTWTDDDGQMWGQWHYVTEYEKVFGKSAYAYVSCNIGDNDYRTTYNIKAVVSSSSTVCDPPRRELTGVVVKGYFSKSEFLSGYLQGHFNGWNVESNVEPAAAVSATGINLLTKRTNEVDAEAPTPVTAVDLEIICDFCNSDGCVVCNQHRTPPWH